MSMRGSPPSLGVNQVSGLAGSLHQQGKPRLQEGLRSQVFVTIRRGAEGWKAAHDNLQKS